MGRTRGAEKKREARTASTPPCGEQNSEPGEDPDQALHVKWVQPLPKELRAQLVLAATEARHRGQYGAMVAALREIRTLDEDLRRHGLDQPPADGALDELTREDDEK